MTFCIHVQEAPYTSWCSWILQQRVWSTGSSWSKSWSILSTRPHHTAAHQILSMMTAQLLGRQSRPGSQQGYRQAARAAQEPDTGLAVILQEGPTR